MQKNLLAAIVISSLTLTACSSRREETRRVETGSPTNSSSQTRQLPDYHALTLKVPADLTIEVGSPGDLSIEANDSVLPHITTTVTDGELLISTDHTLNEIKHLSIRAKSSKLDQLKIDGAANASVGGLSGGGLTVESEGASSINLTGKIDTLTVSLKGASSLKAAGLTAGSAAVSITGAGDAEVNAESSLNATITGAGSIKYKGNPKITQQILGAGSIDKL